MTEVTIKIPQDIIEGIHARVEEGVRAIVDAPGNPEIVVRRLEQSDSAIDRAVAAHYRKIVAEIVSEDESAL